MSINPISVTILDTITGQRVTCDATSQAWWESGSGSCDCNRCLQFDEGAIPKCDDCGVDGKGEGRCCGARRFLIVEASAGDLAGMNSGYPAELAKRWIEKHQAITVPAEHMEIHRIAMGDRYVFVIEGLMNQADAARFEQWLQEWWESNRPFCILACGGRKVRLERVTP